MGQERARLALPFRNFFGQVELAWIAHRLWVGAMKVRIAGMSELMPVTLNALAMASDVVRQLLGRPNIVAAIFLQSMNSFQAMIPTLLR
jgi:hypothetical protein